jgi:hypothetical protein
MLTMHTPTLARTGAAILLMMTTLSGGLPAAQAAVSIFHFDSICRSDPAASKNTVTATLHDDNHMPLADVTLNALWTYVDYRYSQNRAVFRYKQVSCTTDRDGVCTFNGGSGRARWQLAEVVGHDLGSPAFDTEPTPLCPNTTMIDFW